MQVLYLLSYEGSRPHHHRYMRYMRCIHRRQTLSTASGTRRVHETGWSGKRDSNPRPSAWKADALPTELFPPDFIPVTRLPEAQPCSDIAGPVPSGPWELRATMMAVIFVEGRSQPAEPGRCRLNLFQPSDAHPAELQASTFSATACNAKQKTSWWGGEDSNLRSVTQQIYSLPPLTTREPPQPYPTRHTAGSNLAREDRHCGRSPDLARANSSNHARRAAPPGLDRFLRRSAPGHLTRQSRWSWRRDLNPQPSHYK